MKTILYLIIGLLLPFYNFACTGGDFPQGTLTPTSSYQTEPVVNGDYFEISVSCGTTYNFDFCGNGGSSGSLYPEISVLDITGTTEYAFSGYVGGCSTLSWTATFTGTIRLLITDSGCWGGGSWSGTMAYNQAAGGPIDPSFTLSVICGGGTSTVTGTPGGTFSLAPDPGDGVQVDASTGTVSNGTVGITYTVQYAICGNTSTQNVTVLDDDCWTLNGDAQYINVGGEQCIQLTDEINNQTGCAWSGSQIDFATDFTLTLDYYFGNNIGGADGNTFTFQPSSSTACGQNGGQLGAGGLSNALSIEFDTYDNDNPTHLYDMSCDHIAVEIDGSMMYAAPYCGPVCAKAGGGNIDDGGTYTVDIQWDASAQQLQIYFDGNLRLSCNGDFVNTVFGGQSQVYWGATSATGGLNNQQYFCPSSIVILPVELVEFYSNCEQEKEVFHWTTASENRVDHFTLEYTYDGLVFYPVETVLAIGNSTEEHNYSISVPSQDIKQRYYRLKSVDEDGKYTYTAIISSKNCGTSILINTIQQNEQSVTFNLNDDCNLKLINRMGQLIYENGSSQQKVFINKQTIATGLYLVQVMNESGIVEQKKIFISK